VALFEADRVAQSGHGYLQIAVLDGARGHQSGERLGDDVELFLRGLGAATPGVLQQSDEQQREDACDSMDSHLPGLWIAPQREADEPARHNRYADEEERRAADPLVSGLNEAVEG
jgi:hypothetical protein